MSQYLGDRFHVGAFEQHKRAVVLLEIRNTASYKR
jgi:hypothetical protein